MASTTNILVLLVVAIALPAIAMATEFVVGGNVGWKVGQNYQDWANNYEFVVGDTLVFNYKPEHHNVFKIANASDFNDCVKPPPSNALTSGHDVIPLAKPGKKWYICGISDHCSAQGMKFSILVKETASPAPAPSSVAHRHTVASAVAVAVAAAIMALLY